jgi:hypothetical protein
MTEFKLINGIIALSVANTWEVAKLEWQLLNVHKEDEPDTCLCGHFPIIEICELINVKNRNTTIVGNCCVKKFLGLRSDKIFESIRKLAKDETKSINGETLEHAHDKRWINDWEYQFYSDVIGKRKLTEKQKTKKLQINQKIKQSIINSRKRLM